MRCSASHFYLPKSSLYRDSMLSRHAWRKTVHISRARCGNIHSLPLCCPSLAVALTDAHLSFYSAPTSCSSALPALRSIIFSIQNGTSVHLCKSYRPSFFSFPKFSCCKQILSASLFFLNIPSEIRLWLKDGFSLYAFVPWIKFILNTLLQKYFEMKHFASHYLFLRFTLKQFYFFPIS